MIGLHSSVRLSLPLLSMISGGGESSEWVSDGGSLPGQGRSACTAKAAWSAWGPGFRSSISRHWSVFKGHSKLAKQRIRDQGRKFQTKDTIPLQEALQLFVCWEMCRQGLSALPTVQGEKQLALPAPSPSGPSTVSALCLAKGEISRNSISDTDKAHDRARPWEVQGCAYVCMYISSS